MGHTRIVTRVALLRRQVQIALGRAGAFVPGTHGGWIAERSHYTTDQNESWRG